MGTMLYNGVELPDIETVWTDKEAYPYAYLGRNHYTDSVVLAVSKRNRTANASGAVTIQTADFTLGSVQVFSLLDGAWVSSERAAYFIYVSWSNTDVYYTSTVESVGGTLYLAASDPVDPNAPTVDTSRRLKSLINGLLCGLVSPGQLKAREATMYSYNGVVLPKLPEWDRETYPYVCIVKYLIYYAFFTTEPLVAEDELVYATSGDMMTAHQTSTSKWMNPHNCDGDELGRPIWSNYDVLNSDGSVYLSASVPVPVYE